MFIGLSPFFALSKTNNRLFVCENLFLCNHSRQSVIHLLNMIFFANHSIIGRKHNLSSPFTHYMSKNHSDVTAIFIFSDHATFRCLHTLYVTFSSKCYTITHFFPFTQDVSKKVPMSILYMQRVKLPSTINKTSPKIKFKKKKPL